MYHLHLPNNWELTIGLQSHLTRIATEKETLEMEQKCYDALIYYYNNMEQLNSTELDDLFCLLIQWKRIIINPRLAALGYPVYKNRSTWFNKWFQQLETMYEQTKKKT